MKLKSAQSYLVLQASEAARTQSTVRITHKLSSAIRDWTAHTRISPVYSVTGTPAESPLTDDFEGSSSIIFLGPTRPFDVLPCINGLADPVKLWITLGAFNVILVTRSSADAGRIKRWAERNNVRWERWSVSSGMLAGRPVYWHPSASASEWRMALANVIVPTSPPELEHVLDEYRALMASALSRAHAVAPELAKDLELANTIVLRRIEANVVQDRLGTVALLIDVNAALSRFASQTFSGCSPITETECHFWTHSLLGTAVANLALYNLRMFLQGTLGNARIPERVLAFESIQRDLPHLGRITSFAHSAWRSNWIDQVVPGQPLEALFPQITYLSGRDGFRTTETTLSAPLSTVTSCSSLRWSLLTVTHEVTHTIIGGVLSVMLPDFRVAQEVADTVGMLNGFLTPRNLLEELRQFLIRVMFEMDQAEGIRAPEEVTINALVDIVRRRKEEVEEIMVHTFDFLYFYGQKPEVYVPAIWHSWNAIPHLEPKIEEYIIRTVCAVLVNHLDIAKPLTHAQQDVLAALASCGTEEGAYSTTAAKRLLDEWSARIEQRVSARMALVAIVYGFLHSPELLQAVRGQAAHSRRASGGRASEHTALVLSGHRVENPLRFVEDFTSTDCKVTESVWMLETLAFNCLGDA